MAAVVWDPPWSVADGRFLKVTRETTGSSLEKNRNRRGSARAAVTHGPGAAAAPGRDGGLRAAGPVIPAAMLTS